MAPHRVVVAVDQDRIVGHVIATRGWLEPFGTPVLGIGPLGVLPEVQGRRHPDRLSGPPLHGTFRYADPFGRL